MKVSLVRAFAVSSLSASLGILSQSSLSAADATWNTGSGTWVTGSNWSSGSFPGSTTTPNDDTAYFNNLGGSTARTITINTLYVKSISFDGSTLAPTTISGTGGSGTLNLTSGGAITVGSALGSPRAMTIGSDVLIRLLGESATYSFISNENQTRGLVIAGNVVGASTGSNVTTLTLGGAGSATSSTVGNTVTGTVGNGVGGGKLAIAKTGVSTWNLTNTGNTFTGGVNISGGTLVFASGALGTSGNITFSGASTLQWLNTHTEDISARFANSTSAIRLDIGANNVNFATGINSSNTGGFTKAGTGTLTLSGASTYSGTTSVTGGILKAGVASVANVSGAFGLNTNLNVTNSGTVEITGYDTQVGALYGGGAVNLGAATLTVGGANATTANIYSGVMSGTGRLVKIGTGTITLSGTNTYSGGTTFGGGIVNAAAASLGTTGNLTFTGGTLQYATGNTQDYSSRFADSTGAITVDSNGNNLVFNNAIGSTNTGGLVKSGTGTLTLNAGNAYLGGTTLSGTQTVTLGHRLAFSSGTVTTTGALIISSSTDLSGVNKVANNLVLGGNFSTDASSSALEIGGNVNMGASLREFRNNSTNRLTLSGVISNSGSTGARFVSVGDMLVSGTNTYAGSTEIRGNRSVIVTQIGNVGNAGNFGVGQTITFGANSATQARLQYEGTGEVINRTLDLNTSTAEISIEQAGSGTLHFTGAILASGTGSKTLNLRGSTVGVGQIDGVILDNSSTNKTSVDKNGSGTWILGGVNTYTGATTIRGGTLIINGATSADSVVTVENGGTLGGSGTVGGAVTVKSGGALAPGNSPGLLTVGSLSLESGSQTNLEINGFDRGVSYDAVNVTGSLIYGGALTLNIATTFLDETVNLFTFASQSGDFGSVTLAGLYSGSLTNTNGVWSGNVGGLDFTFDQANGNLSSVPEPMTWALLAMGLVSILWRKQHRNLQN